MEPHILERAEHPISRHDIDPDVLKVLYRLIKAGHIAYLVGGGVRDLMLGRRPKDFDVATDAHPQQVRDLFRNSRLIGRRFRLVHVFFGPKNIEVATFRRRSEEASENDPLIRSDNTFGTPEEDAFRRDFTVNALFYDPQTFRVIDYAGGVADLRARLIRTIGDPELRMREDPVRMMRAVRFAAKLGFQIESSTRAAIDRHRADLLKASIPRLVEETYRTIGQTGASRAIALMEEFGLLELLFPFLASHLRAGPHPLENCHTSRNLAALGEAISNNAQLGHEEVLAAIFLDVHLAGAAVDHGCERPNLIGELRMRGFAKADVENMRVLLETYPLLAEPSRRTRRIIRRPQFERLRRFFEMMAPGYDCDTSRLASFIANPDSYLAAQGGIAPRIPGRHSRRRRRRRRARPTDRSHLVNQGTQPSSVASPALISATSSDGRVGGVAREMEPRREQSAAWPDRTSITKS